MLSFSTEMNHRLNANLSNGAKPCGMWPFLCKEFRQILWLCESPSPIFWRYFNVITFNTHTQFPTSPARSLYLSSHHAGMWSEFSTM